MLKQCVSIIIIICFKGIGLFYSFNLVTLHASCINRIVNESGRFDIVVVVNVWYAVLQISYKLFFSIVCLKLLLFVLRQ